MPQVEHVPLGRASPGDHVPGTLFDNLPGSEQDRRVKVALQRLPRFDAPDGLVKRDTPVDPDHVGADLPHQPEQLAGADPEVNARYASRPERGENPAGMRQYGVPVVVRADRADPRIEELYRRGARRHLDLKERDRDVGEPSQQSVPQLGVSVHQRLGPVVILGGSPLHQIGRERERAAREADQRAFIQLGDEGPHRLGDVGHVPGIERAQPRQVCRRPHGSLDYRPDSGLDVDIDAYRA